MKKGQGIEMPRLYEHSCGRLAACAGLAPIHTFINDYPFRGGSQVQHRLSCTRSGSNDLVKRNL
jgi:hypothetical protein